MNDAISVVSQLHTDYMACKAAFQSSRSEAATIAEAVQSRLQRARERDAARRSELEAITADPERSPTIQGLAEKELEHIAATVYAPAEAEQAAFEAATQTARQAISDARQIQTSLRAALADLGKAVKQIRAATLGDPDLELLPRWIESVERDFARLEALE